jgi:hypothetical protein
MLRKPFVSALILGGFSVFALPAEAARVRGVPIDRGDSYGCSFRCPAGLVRINSIEFWFEFQGVPLYKNDRDGGLLVCSGERRVVGEVLPSVVGFFADIQSCSVNYSGFFGNAPEPNVCDEFRLNECIRYGGGDACYEKWCTN